MRAPVSNCYQHENHRLYLTGLTLEELRREMKLLGEAPYRAKQIFSWLYKKGKCRVDEMSDMPARLREKLNNMYCTGALKLAENLKSSDGTEKFLFELKAGNFIETVLIPSEHRHTICVSTQVGCKYNCSFCASGLFGFTRNLLASEIMDQLLYLKFKLKRPFTNIVFMGMGEPLDNYENVAKAVLIMTDPAGLGIAAKRITISTCGIVPGIAALKTLKRGINLSFSLHAVCDELRNAMMPVNKKYPLKDVIGACRDFAETAKGNVTFEYVLIRGVNDSVPHAEKLAALAKRALAKVNLIIYSPIPRFKLMPSDEKSIKAFFAVLKGKKIKATLRQSKGADIAAACGQLAGRRP